MLYTYTICLYLSLSNDFLLNTFKQIEFTYKNIKQHSFNDFIFIERVVNDHLSQNFNIGHILACLI